MVIFLVSAKLQWHSVLYHHCTKLAIGESSIEFVKLKFIESENVGLIAVGQGESFINSIGIRRAFEKDEQFFVDLSIVPSAG